MADFEPVLLRRIDRNARPVAGGLPRRRRLPRPRQGAQRDDARRRSTDVVKASGLRGRGGAGFPTGVKWTFLPKDHPGPIYLCVNADESEPCTFNNRILMEEDPHQVLEGIILACYAIKAPASPTSTSATSTARPRGPCRRPSTRLTPPNLLGQQHPRQGASTSTSSSTAAPGPTSAARRRA